MQCTFVCRIIYRPLQTSLYQMEFTIVFKLTTMYLSFNMHVINFTVFFLQAIEVLRKQGKSYRKIKCGDYATDIH